MFIQHDGKPFWLINGTADEATAIAGVTKRNKLLNDTMYRIVISAMILSFMLLMYVGFFTENTSDVMTTLWCLSPLVLSFLLWLGSLLLYDPRRPFSQREDEGRIVSLWSSEGEMFTDVLFSGERKLIYVTSKYLVLERIDPTPVNEFWVDAKNQRVMAYLHWYRTGEAKELAHRVLENLMSAVIDAATPHIDNLRKLELSEKEADASQTKRQDREAYDELREFLKQEDIFPNE